MNPDLEKAMDIINSLTKAHHDMKEEAKAHNMDEEKSMHEDEEDEEMQAKGYKDKKNKNTSSLPYLRKVILLWKADQL